MAKRPASPSTVIIPSKEPRSEVPQDMITVNIKALTGASFSVQLAASSIIGPRPTKTSPCGVEWLLGKETDQKWLPIAAKIMRHDFTHIVNYSHYLETPVTPSMVHETKRWLFLCSYSPFPIIHPPKLAGVIGLLSPGFKKEITDDGNSLRREPTEVENHIIIAAVMAREIINSNGMLLAIANQEYRELYGAQSELWSARDSETSTTADAEAGTGEKKDEEDNNSLTAAICAKNGAPGDMQRIIFGGRQLEPQETLSGVGIKDGSTIHLVLRLSGC